MELAARRLQHLIEDLIAEQRVKHGAQTRVAAQLGVGEAIVSRAKKGSKSDVESKTLEAVCRALRLDPAYFFSQPDADRLSYRDFVRTPQPRPPAESVQWREFAEKWHRFDELTPLERDALRRMLPVNHKILDWSEFVPVAEWLIARRVTPL